MFPSKFIVGLLLLGTTLVRGDEKIEPADIWDDAEDALQNFIATVMAALDEADKVFDQVDADVRALSITSLEQAEIELQVVVDFMAGEVADIRTHITDQNQAQLEHCIGIYATEMRRIPEVVRARINECVTALEEDTTLEIRIARLQAHNQMILAHNFRLDIDGCQIVTDSRECISRVVIEILLQTLEVPTVIQELARRTTDIVDYYMRAIPECSQERIRAAQVLSGSVIGSIRSCADVVLNPPN